jgi:hypothetical protein
MPAAPTQPAVDASSSSRKTRRTPAEVAASIPPSSRALRSSSRAAQPLPLPAVPQPASITNVGSNTPSTLSSVSSTDLLDLLGNLSGQSTPEPDREPSFDPDRFSLPPRPHSRSHSRSRSRSRSSGSSYHSLNRSRNPTRDINMSDNDNDGDQHPPPPPPVFQLDMAALQAMIGASVTAAVAATMAAAPAPAPAPAANPAPAPAPAARVSRPKIRQYPSNAFSVDKHYTNQDNLLVLGRNMWNSWLSNLLQHLALCQLADWVDVPGRTNYVRRPVITLQSDQDEIDSEYNWETNDGAVRGCLRVAIHPEEFVHIENLPTAKAMMDTLIVRHSAGHRLAVYNDLGHCFTLVDDMHSAAAMYTHQREVFSKLTQVFTVMGGTITFEDAYIGCMIKMLVGKDAMPFRNELVGRLAEGNLTRAQVTTLWNARADSLASTGQVDDETLLFAKAGGTSQCHNCGGVGHHWRKCSSPPNTKEESLVKQILAHGERQIGRNSSLATSASFSHSSSRSTTPLYSSYNSNPRGSGTSSRALAAVRPRGRGNGQRHTANLATLEHNGQSYTLVPTTAVAAAATFAESLVSTASVTEEEDFTGAPWEQLGNVAVTEPVDDDLLMVMQIANNPPPAIPYGNNAPAKEDEEYRLTTNQVALMHMGTAGWYLDSGATMTCTPNEDELTDVKCITPIPIRGVGGSRIHASKIGTLSLTLRDRSVLKIPEVLVVPDAAIRLISIGRLADLGYSTIFQDSRTALIARKKNVLASASRAGRGLYAIDVYDEPTALFAVSEQIACAAVGLDVWHARLGHPGNAVIEQLARSQAVKGMHLDLSTTPPVCEPCVQGKQKHTSVPKRREGDKSDAFLRLVFVDLAGSEHRVATIHGEHYRLTIVDDYSGRTWCDLLKTKDEAFDKLVAWYLRMKNQGYTIAEINLDNGELKSDRFRKWCELNGIAWRFTAPYSSAQNGRVERKHHTIDSRARAARIACGLPERCWGLMCMAVAYLDNYLPSSSLPSGATPLSLQYGRAMDVSHLRELGCKAFMLVQPQSKRSKIRPQSREMVFVGYAPHSKSYLLYDRSSGAVHTSRDVVFIESWQTEPRPYKPGKVLGSTLPADEPHSEGWPKPLSPSTSISSPSHSSTSVSPVLVPVPVQSLSSSSPPNDTSPVLPSDDHAPLIDFNTPAHNPLHASVSPSTSVSSSASSAIPDLPPSSSTRSKTRNTQPTPPSFTLSHDVSGSDSVPILRRSKRVADLLGAKIQSGRSSVRRSRRRARKANDGRAADAYAAMEEGGYSSDELLALLACAMEEEDVSIAEVFGELLDVDLVDLAYSLDIESDDQEEPKTLKQALSGPDRAKWRQALIEEFQAIADLGVFRLIPRREVPVGRRILTGKPVFKVKRDENGDPTRWKARWVVKGFLQVFGIDYDKTTSPTARLETFRLLCHIMASEGLAMRQFDVKTAFLHGELPADERVYMQQPPGFEDAAHPDHVWMLVKALYGMKQAGRVWNQTFNDALVNDFGFKRVTNEHCLYIRASPSGGFSMASIHVDDTFAIGSSEEELDQLQRDLESKWEISVGDGSFILGIHVKRDLERRLVHLSQTALIDRIVEKFGQQNAADVWTPMESGIELSKADSPSTPEEKLAMADIPYRELVGSMAYVGQATRPDIVYAIGRLSKFLANPGRKHWDAAIRVLRYLKTTRLYRLTLGGTTGNTSLSCHEGQEELDPPPPQVVTGMTDSNFAACTDTRRSVSGYAFSLGSGAVSWKSRQQDLVTLSTCEAEYVAASEAAREAVFLRALLGEIGHRQTGPTMILADNQGTIVLTSDQTNHIRTKHIDLRYHFVQDKTADNTIAFKYVRSQDNIADIFTKPLPRPAFAELRKRLGVRAPPSTLQEE